MIGFCLFAAIERSLEVVENLRIRRKCEIQNAVWDRKFK